MNVKKLVALTLALVALSAAACSGAGPTPTRKAVAENGNPTQTPWIIYVPVTTTPEPATVTPLPTVTSAQPTAKPTNTRAPKPAATQQPVALAATATPANTAPPPATPTPSCGEVYQVTQLLFPNDGDPRDVKNGPGAGYTIQFRWAPVNLNKLSPNIGYRVAISSPSNGASLFVSHNGYIDRYMTGNEYVNLSQRGSYGLTGGSDTVARWNVTVVMSSAGFDDNTFTALGSITPCGGSSPTRSVNLKVIE